MYYSKILVLQIKFLLLLEVLYHKNDKEVIV
jgi:hypothetical protein